MNLVESYIICNCGVKWYDPLDPVIKTHIDLGHKVSIHTILKIDLEDIGGEQFVKNS